MREYVLVLKRFQCFHALRVTARERREEINEINKNKSRPRSFSTAKVGATRAGVAMIGKQVSQITETSGHQKMLWPKTSTSAGPFLSSRLDVR